MKKLTTVIFLINIFYAKVSFGAVSKSSQPPLPQPPLPLSPSKSSLIHEVNWHLLEDHHDDSFPQAVQDKISNHYPLSLEAVDSSLKLEDLSREALIGLFVNHFTGKGIKNAEKELREFVKKVLDANSDCVPFLGQDRAQAKRYLKVLYAQCYKNWNGLL